MLIVENDRQKLETLQEFWPLLIPNPAKTDESAV